MNISLAVVWFLWSVIYPEFYVYKEIHAMPVKGFESQAECELALKAYRIEVKKAYPGYFPNESGIPFPSSIYLKCSPINPKP